MKKILDVILGRTKKSRKKPSKTVKVVNRNATRDPVTGAKLRKPGGR